MGMRIFALMSSSGASHDGRYRNLSLLKYLKQNHSQALTLKPDQLLTMRMFVNVRFLCDRLIMIFQ